MRNQLLAAVAAASFFATPALAVATFSDDITSDLVISADGATAEFGNAPVQGNPATTPRVNGFFEFQDTYTFTYNIPGTASGSATNNRVRVSSSVFSDINFASITFNGMAGTVTNSGTVSFAEFGDMPFVSGLQTIVISGTSNATASRPVSYGGSVTILNGAVPEPATWAMLGMGFGLVGVAIRRRRTLATFA